MVGSTDSVRIIVTFLTEDSIDTTTAILTLSTENCLVADHALVDVFFLHVLGATSFVELIVIATTKIQGGVTAGVPTIAVRR